MLYTHWIGNQPSNTIDMFKMRDSVPSARYSSVCNVLRLWNTRSSLLIESTASMINVAKGATFHNIIICISNCMYYRWLPSAYIRALTRRWGVIIDKERKTFLK